jgi:hypothetical protein
MNMNITTRKISFETAINPSLDPRLYGTRVFLLRVDDRSYYHRFDGGRVAVAEHVVLQLFGHPPIDLFMKYNTNDVIASFVQAGLTVIESTEAVSKLKEMGKLFGYDNV